MSRRARAYAVLLPLCLSGSAFAQGMLIPTDPSLQPLNLKYQRVTADITDAASVTKVEQVFVNDTPRPLEATYLFPLPKGAALSEFAMWINGKKTKGEVLERQKAAEIYEGIVRRLKDPGLLEYMDNDLFRARVFPVPANGEQRIEISFSQVLDYQSGLYHYAYPLGAATHSVAGGWFPRRPWTPPNEGPRPPQPPPGKTQVEHDFTFAARIAAKVPIKSIYSPTHAIQIGRKDDRNAIVGLEEGGGSILHDLDLYYSVSEKDVGLSLLSYRTGDDPGYFLMLISPKQEYQRNETMGKRVTLVLDSSGSMEGEKIRAAKAALKYCLSRLGSDDQFNVIRFSTDVETLFDRLQPANQGTVKKATEFVDNIPALGATAIDEALTRALADGGDHPDRHAPHIVIFITDGEPTIGETDEQVIAQHARATNKANSRIFTFGVGDEINARLLDRLAAEGGGASEYIRGGSDFEAKIAGFYDKLSHPVLSEVNVALGSIGAYDIYPHKLPDLFKGSQLTIVGRYRAPGDSKVQLTGFVSGQSRTYDYGANFPQESKAADFIPRLWAVRKVGYLIDEIRLHGERSELRDEVTTLGKRFGIVTPYTSYLVVEDEPVNRPVAQPQPNWPVFGPTGGEDRSPPPAPPAETSAQSGGGTSSVFAPAPEVALRKKAFARPESLGAAVGNDGIAVAQATREMKEEEKTKNDIGVQSVAGRTYLLRRGAWIDAAIGEKPPQIIQVKYLSDAYFALVRARPELKGALALGNHVTVLVAANKAVEVRPDRGEEKADALLSFLK
jgi:Ca-activated chloride channel homolog